ncbi:MAG: hypothetical protein WCF44_22085, partial [Candidatus Methylophosphatis roskildensis]
HVIQHMHTAKRRSCCRRSFKDSENHPQIPPTNQKKGVFEASHVSAASAHFVVLFQALKVFEASHVSAASAVAEGSGPAWPVSRP